MFSDAPPSREDVTTSDTCLESMDVKTFTNSGITAPASVPQEMINASFHHSVVSAVGPSDGTISLETTKVRAMEINEVSQTSEVSGVSKFILSEFSYFAFAKASFTKYATAAATTIMMRIAKIHTSSTTWSTGRCTPSRMKVINATPVTP